MSVTFPNFANAEIEVEAWATPAPGWTLEELIVEMGRLGNPILEVDAVNNRLKVLHVRQQGLIGGTVA